MHHKDCNPFDKSSLAGIGRGMHALFSRPPARLAAALLLAALPSCKPAGPGGNATAATAPAEQRYPLTGEILKVDAVKNTLLVRHEAVPNYMPGMTMEFAVSPADAATTREGERIRAELVVDATGARLEKIWPVDAVADSTVAAAAGALRQETSIRGKSAYREIGENLPDFTLYDQEARVVSAARFRGRQIMLNFIYSRCPIATMCPAATTQMMAVQRKAREAGVKNLELVSITLDPEFDTPGVLKAYARVRGIDTANFSFLTGPEGAIKDLLTQFGVVAEFDGSILKHSLATLLINADGKIIWRADGSQWSPDEFVGRMKKE